MPAILETTRFTLTGLDAVAGFLVYFYLFGVIGWFVEMLYLATAGRGLINSGFLQGPICPAYAAGVLIIYPFTILFAPLPFWVQALLYALLATVVEYAAHITLEKILGLRIWDYSDEFMNLHGRISLKYSAFWFVLVLLLVLVAQPVAIALIESMPRTVMLALAALVAVVLAVDYTISALLFSFMSKRIDVVCEAFHLPVQEMHDLQFNRPRIMNEKKRLAALFSDPAYVDLDKRVVERLFSGDRFDTFGFSLEVYKDITENAAYVAWRKASEQNESLYHRYQRIAELSYAFCTILGVDATAAARGVLLSVYTAEAQQPLQKLADLVFKQRRILRSVRRDVVSIGRIERDVILHYTWPLNFGSPRTAECLMASFAEKLVASREHRAVLGTLYAPIMNEA